MVDETHFRTDLDTQRHAAHLPVRIFESGRMHRKIRVGSDARVLQPRHDILDALGDLRSILIARLGRHARRNDDSLNLGYPRRQDEALVVTMNHDHDTDRPRRQTPRILPNVDLFPITRRIFDDDVEHLAEVLTETMRRRSLNPSSDRRYETLDRRRIQSTGEFLLFALDSGDDGHSEEVFVNSSVEFEDLSNFGAGFFFGQEGRVTFLPEEFSSTKEGLRRFEFPADDAVPLIELEREVAVRADPLRAGELARLGGATKRTLA